MLLGRVKCLKDFFEFTFGYARAGSAGEHWAAHDPYTKMTVDMGEDWCPPEFDEPKEHYISLLWHTASVYTDGRVIDRGTLG